MYLNITEKFRILIKQIGRMEQNRIENKYINNCVFKVNLEFYYSWSIKGLPSNPRVVG